MTAIDRLAEKAYGKRILGVVDVASTRQRQVGVVLDLPEDRHELYRSLLPAGVAPAPVPRLYVYLVDILENRVLGPYRELGVCLSAVSPADTRLAPGRHGWVVSEMVVDGVRARWGGLAVGYPKVMGRMALGRVPGGWSGTVERGGEAVVALHFGEGDAHAAWMDELRIEDPFYLFAFGRLNIMEFTPEPETTVTRATGTARLAFGAERPWTALLGSREVEAPALFTALDGPAYLTRRGA